MKVSDWGRSISIPEELLVITPFPRAPLGDLHNELTKAVTADVAAEEKWGKLRAAAEALYSGQAVTAQKCEPWCGKQEAYCTAACLERATAASMPAGVVTISLTAGEALGAEPEKPRREPVAPWRAALCWGGECQSCDQPFVYLRADLLTGACEACAERAGVFGPVAQRLAAQDPGAFGPTKDSEPAGRGGVAQPNAGLPKNESVTAGETAPIACSGPLATHGTPVLRVVGVARCRVHLCDDCYRDYERDITEITNADASWLADGAQPKRGHEPPARIGTVPQVFGLNVGVWASRGMR